MRGTILHYDSVSGVGHISGDDNNRYTFTRADINPASNPGPGMFVDFVASGTVATEIFAVPGGNPAMAAGAPAQAYAAAAPTEAPEPELGLWGYFVRAISSHYFRFRGRARRKEFWGFILFSCIISLVLSLVMVAGIAGSDLDGIMRLLERGEVNPQAYVPLISPLTGWGLALLGIYGLIMLIPSLSITVRRFHDVGFSGWLYLLAIIIGGIFGSPAIKDTGLGLVGTAASLAVLVVCLMNSKAGANRWGPNPKGL